MLKEVSVPTLEERVAYLEGQVSEHAHTLVDIRESIRQLERRCEARFDVVDRRLESLNEKVDRHFTWLVGIQVTTLVAIVGALLARP
jgi:uncharacterized Rmd1/YagE family protein